jgi:phosphoribosylglycinamide formyltransferase 1
MALKKRIAVLASGRGTNFRAILRAIQEKRVENAEVIALITNNSDAQAIQIAEEHKVPVHIIPSQKFTSEGKLDRERYENALLEKLREVSPDLICLAGYMLLLGPKVIQAFRLRILNIHPSLLPHFRGLKAQEQALEAGARETGCTVHFVTEEMDAGPIVSQSRIAIHADETIESLKERMLPLEHATYTEALQIVCDCTFRIEGDRIYLLN